MENQQDFKKNKEAKIEGLKRDIEWATKRLSKARDHYDRLIKEGKRKSVWEAVVNKIDGEKEIIRRLKYELDIETAERIDSIIGAKGKRARFINEKNGNGNASFISVGESLDDLLRDDIRVGNEIDGEDIALRKEKDREEEMRTGKKSFREALKVKNIGKCEDGSYLVETEASVYRLNIEEEEDDDVSGQNPGHGANSQPNNNNDIPDVDYGELDEEWKKKEEELEKNRKAKKDKLEEDEINELGDQELADRIKQGSKEEGWDKKELSAEEIEEILKKNVDDARAEYARQDYAADKKKGIFKRILGIGVDNIHSDTVSEAYRKYQISLRELADHRTLKMRGANLDAESLHKQSQELLKYFDTDEKLNLYESRTNARTEAWKDKFGGKVMEKAGNFVNWYRKQKWWAKTGIGIALTMSGFGAAAMGMRAVGGAAAGVGTTAWLEGRHRRKESQQAESRRNESMKQLEGAEMEQKLNQLTLMLDAEMDTYHKSLKNEKNKAKNRALIGAGLGVFIGSGAMSEMFQKIGDVPFVKVATEYWGGKLHGIGSMISGINNPDISETMSAHGTKIPNEMMSGHDPNTGMSHGEYVDKNGMSYGSYKDQEMSYGTYEDQKMSYGTSELSGNAENGMSHGTSELSSKASEIGYQGGNSVWSEAEKQLTARMRSSFDNLGGGDAKMAEALKTINVDRLKDVIVGDPEKYGLPKGIDFNRMSAEQIGGIAWSNAIKDAIGDASGLTESVSLEDAQSILDNNEALQNSVEAPGVEKVAETATASTPENATEVISGAESVADGADYEKFIEESNRNIKNVIQERQAIYDKYPQFADIKDFDGEMARLQGEIDAGQWAAVDGADVGSSVQDNIKELNRLKELKGSFEEAYFKGYFSFSGADNPWMRGVLESASAKDYVAQHGQEKAVKIFNSLKAAIGPEQVKELKLDPSGNETAMQWSKRVYDVILKNLGKK